MPKLDFPLNPTEGQTYTDDNGQIWTYDNGGWLRGDKTGPVPVVQNPTGYKNVLINGRLGPVGSPWIINQREFDGDWAALPNEYGYDRWAKNSLTQIIQHIEPGNVILGQTYTLSWEGGGLGYFSTDPQDSVTESPFIGVASDNTLGPHTDAVVPIGAFNIQLELGSVPTPFEIRPIGLELALCQRFYRVHAGSTSGWWYSTAGTTRYVESFNHPVEMYRNPDVTVNVAPTLNNASNVTVSLNNKRCTITATVNVTGQFYVRAGQWNFNAEIQ